jgi:hypothetical protein
MRRIIWAAIPKKWGVLPDDLPLVRQADVAQLVVDQRHPAFQHSPLPSAHPLSRVTSGSVGCAIGSEVLCGESDQRKHAPAPRLSLFFGFLRVSERWPGPVRNPRPVIS